MLIAHLVNTGLGPFYDGITHLAMTPEDILPVLALAALAGLGGTARGRTLLALLPAAWLLGGLLGLRHDAEISMPIVATLSFLVPGALVAADIRLPSIVVGGLALGIGVLQDI